MEASISFEASCELPDGEVKIMAVTDPIPPSPARQFREIKRRQLPGTPELGVSDNNNRAQSSSKTLTAEEVLAEAKEVVERKRNLRFDDAWTRQILEDAKNSSRRREAQIRSTTEVLRMAGAVLPVSPATTPKEQLNGRLYSASSISEGPRSPVVRTRGSTDKEISRCVSPSDSSITSFDDLEKALRGLPAKLGDSASSMVDRKVVLNQLDGIGKERKLNDRYVSEEEIIVVSNPAKRSVQEESKRQTKKEEAESNTASVFSFSFNMPSLFGIETKKLDESRNPPDDVKVRNNFNPLACGGMHIDDLMTGDDFLGLNSDGRTTIGTRQAPPAHAETVKGRVVDKRMPSFLSDLGNSAETGQEGLSEYFYTMGKSRTVVVHEIMRGNWTWCTAWSPDGDRLAIATENHHLAIVDTTDSAVWRVKHDRRIVSPIRNDTTHSIRSIAWGSSFIAVGGTGDAVSILAPTEPYPVVHTIKGTGFVGSLDWRIDSVMLAVGSREDKCSIYSITTQEDDLGGEIGVIRRIASQELYKITRKDWVNAVKFSPNGSVLAVGDRSGKLSVFTYDSTFGGTPKLNKIWDFKFPAAILDVEWSPDGVYLYCGGEDYAMTIIEAKSWQVKHRVSRERWMQFVSSSNRGTHVAVGGSSSEVTILDAKNKWKSTLGFELNGLVPLSAKWHPKDQFLAVTGQDNSIVAIETTNARHVKGHYLQSFSPVEAVEFSPDGRMLTVANKAGIISFYTTNNSSFETTYEIVLGEGSSQSMVWSPNGTYVMAANGNTLAVIGQDMGAATSERAPAKTCGLGIKKIMRNMETINSVSVHISSRWVALAGKSIVILDAANEFVEAKRWNRGSVKACAWSHDGTWLATIGDTNKLVIFDTSTNIPMNWREVFSVDCEEAGLSLAWGPSVVEGLQYLAYGGEGKKITILEIRTFEGTWETVMTVNRQGSINDLDWSKTGLLAAAIGDGTVTIVDLSYLKSGCAVNEMDYNWQRQGITCFTEIRRNKGKNSMSTIRWIPSKASEDTLLAIGGSDGALEVVDLTARSRCKGFGKRQESRS